MIVLGTFKMAMNLLEGGSTPPAPQAMENTSSQPAPQAPAAGREQARRARAGHAVDDLADADREAVAEQCRAGRTRTPADRPRSKFRPLPPRRHPRRSSDVTGALSGASRARLGMVQVPPSEKLPDGIGGPGLRTAAMKGDATAAYEIGVRFAEGKGVAANYDEAAKWYDRAAQAGVVPATFRLGTLYEKGLGVKKDADIARRYYTQAAERGNAKAMHNLAVLDADGGGRGANYKSAAQWFRKAADRGVADSQFNLGILYARGIGVEQNLAESYKWFTLAAAQGDADAATQARRRRQASRPAIARRRQARDPDLQRRAAARRRRQRPGPRRRLGQRAAGEHKAGAEAGRDEEVGVGGALTVWSALTSRRRPALCALRGPGDPVFQRPALGARSRNCSRGVLDAPVKPGHDSGEGDEIPGVQ